MAGHRSARVAIGRPSGYTLIEVLVVTAIVSIVALIAGVALIHALDLARQRATMADMRSIAEAIESYIADHQEPPPGTGSVNDLIAALTPKYTASLPLTDHWSNGYSYASSGRADYTLESFGKDGTPGADIDLATRFDFDLDIVLANGQFVAAPE